MHAVGTLYHCLLLCEIGIDKKMLRKWLYDGGGSFPIKYSFVEVGLLDKGALEPPVAAKSPGGELPSGAINVAYLR